jgi:transposase
MKKPDPGAEPDRPFLPLLPTAPARRSHDYVRNGTASLFAGPGRGHRQGDLLDAPPPLPPGVPQVPHDHRRRHPRRPGTAQICDNYATHKAPAIRDWLIRYPRFTVHFTPTSSSWLNLVEWWFAELTNRKLRRRSHASVRELEADLRAWIGAWNDNPRPFVWTKTANEILEKIA